MKYQRDKLFDVSFCRDSDEYWRKLDWRICRGEMESFEEFVSVEVRRCINQQRRTEIRKRNNLLPRNSNDKRMGNFLRGRKMEVIMQLVFYIICFIAFFLCPTPHFVFVPQLPVLSYLLRNYFSMFSDSSNFSVAIWGYK